jgi:hypothetical protein
MLWATEFDGRRHRGTSPTDDRDLDSISSARPAFHLAEVV